jgi:hypothetical protein
MNVRAYWASRGPAEPPTIEILAGLLPLPRGDGERAWNSLSARRDHKNAQNSAQFLHAGDVCAFSFCHRPNYCVFLLKLMAVVIYSAGTTQSELVRIFSAKTTSACREPLHKSDGSI